MKKGLRNLTLAAALAAFSIPAFCQVKSDADLVNQVRHALATQPYYNVFDSLAFQVNGSVVTLYGEVTQPVVKDDAERSVKHIEGVTQVVDNIKVLPLSPMDWQIRRAEYRAIFGYSNLYRYAMGAIPSIHIIVENGHVTLEGVVNTQADKNVAGIRANMVPGVFSVDNKLNVARS
jgi:hyperosmotically inducible protein